MKCLSALTKRTQYSLVYQEGRTWVDALLVMKAMLNGLDLSRCGFSVTKKVGSAVQRNRLKRLLREVTRSLLIKPGWDIVFIVRPVAVAADYHQMERAATKLLTQARLLEHDDEVLSSRFN